MDCYSLLWTFLWNFRSRQERKRNTTIYKRSTMQKYLLLLFLISTAVCAFGQFDESQKIDKLFKKFNKTDSPGCALGIIKNGKLTYEKGYGLANLETKTPNTSSTVFRIASTSKQFTAACIVMLAEKNKLSLNDNMQSIFPEFPDYAENITIRHLLNHTSGIRDYIQIAYLKGLDDDDFYTDADVMEWLINQKELNFNPGEKYMYSNSGYWLLGQIVDKVSGMSMADFADKEIFKPLGMNNTHFHNDNSREVQNRAIGYIPEGKDQYKTSMTQLEMIGDGGIFTTINDIKKWDDAFYNSDVLSKEFWAIMTEKGFLNNGTTLDYAAGLEISTYKGLNTIRHDGSFVGFKADLLRFPDQKLTIAIFANNADLNPKLRANQVADLLLEDRFMESNSIKQNHSKVDNNSFIHLNSKELKRFTGKYWNESESFSRKIYLKNGTLRYYRNKYSESQLKPISANEFNMMDVNADVRIRFENNGNQSMTFYESKGDSLFFSAYESKKYTSKELVEFEGDYYSEDLDVTYSLKLERRNLTMYLGKTKISNLKAIKEDVFSNGYYSLYQFNYNEKGQLTGFRYSSPRVMNLNFYVKLIIRTEQM